MEHFDDRSTRYALVKKGGSSTLGHALRKGARGGAPLHRFVTVIRNPYARLLSGWADLIRDRDHGFGGVPPTERKVWTRFAVAQCKRSNPDMDHHFREQWHDLNHVIGFTELEPGGRLYIGCLERMDVVWPKLEGFVGRKLERQHRRRSEHVSVEEAYENPRVRRDFERRYAIDIALWRTIHDAGGWYESPHWQDWKEAWHELLTNASN